MKSEYSMGESIDIAQQCDLHDIAERGPKLYFIEVVLIVLFLGLFIYVGLFAW